MPSRIKQHISFYDKSFSESNTNHFILCLQLGNKSLAYTIFNPEVKKYIVFDSFNFTETKSPDDLTFILKNLFEEKIFLKKKYLKVFFLIDNQLNTLLPPPLFIEEKAMMYLQFNHPVNEGQMAYFNTLNNSHVINIFSVPDVLVDFVMKTWSNAQLYHSSSAIIESLSINFKNKINNKALFLNVRDEGYDLVYFKNNRLHFHNLFRYNTKEDFIYFLLSAIEELQLNPEEVELVLIGNIDKSSILYEMIFRYVRTSNFISRNDNYGYSYMLDGLMRHKNYTLFNVQQCV